MSSAELTCFWLGRRRYGIVDVVQREQFEARRAGEVGDVVLMSEFEPVITLGRGAKPDHLLSSSEQLNALGVELVQSDRGGDITLHAPGQLVCYPIVQLPEGRRDVRRYVGDLTRVMQRVAATHGIDAGRFNGRAEAKPGRKPSITGDLIGLWTDAQTPQCWRPESAATPVKLGAIGVRLSRWVTLHGFALNLSTDLDLYRLIVPCGIRAFGVASLASVGAPTPAPSLTAAAALAADVFAELWNREQRESLVDLASVPDAELGHALRRRSRRRFTDQESA